MPLGTLEKVKNFEARSSLGYRLKTSFLKGCWRPSETVSHDEEYKPRFVSCLVDCIPLGRVTLKTVFIERFVYFISVTKEGIKEV